METNALLAFDEDVINRNWIDWLQAHTSFFKPLHRYEGRLELLSDKLVFTGIDTKTKEEIHFEFFRHEIEQLYLGFDDTFSPMEVRNPFGWVPLRLTINQRGETHYLYMITNYIFGHTDNQQWFEYLKEWAG